MTMKQQLSEVPQVVVHQARVFTCVSFCKEAESTSFVENDSICIGIYSKHPAPGRKTLGQCGHNQLDDELPYAFMSIALVNGQTAYLHGRVMGTLFGMWNVPVDTITGFFVFCSETHLIVKQAIISNNVICVRVKYKICHSQKFLLIVLGFGQQKVVQVLISTLERPYFGVRLQPDYVVRLNIPHLIQLLRGSDMTASYILRACSISSFGAGCGVEIYSKNCSASLPESVGVSLMGLAIIPFSYCFTAQRYKEIMKQQNNY